MTEKPKTLPMTLTEDDKTTPVEFIISRLPTEVLVVLMRQRSRELRDLSDELYHRKERLDPNDPNAVTEEMKSPHPRRGRRN